MKRNKYSKNWCEGFCRKCGSSCAEYLETEYELRSLLKQVIPYIQCLDDEGPEGSRWQSEALEKLIDKIRQESIK